MASFHVGDIVRVIAGPRTGEVTTVESELVIMTSLAPSTGTFYPAEPVHELGIPPVYDGTPVCAPPAWLEHYREPAVDAMLGRLGIRESEEA